MENEDPLPVTLAKRLALTAETPGASLALTLLPRRFPSRRLEDARFRDLDFSREVHNDNPPISPSHSNVGLAENRVDHDAVRHRCPCPASELAAVGGPDVPAGQPVQSH